MSNVIRDRRHGGGGTTLALALAVALLPIGLTSLLYAVAAIAGIDLDGIGPIGSYGWYAVALAASLAITVAAYERERLRSLAPIERPSGRQLLAAVGGAAVGIGVFPVVEVVNDALGLTFAGGGYTLADPVSLAAILLSAVVLAPIVEEVLFRGILLGTLLERGWHPVLAGGATVAVFAAMHVVSLGAGGVVYIAVWATLPTAMRFAFDDLSGAMLLHAINNLWAYVFVVVLFE